MNDKYFLIKTTCTKIKLFQKDSSLKFEIKLVALTDEIQRYVKFM